jgi:hypothetical protein
MRRPGYMPAPRQLKAADMATKQIFEGARSFKPVLTPDPNAQPEAAPERSLWRWPKWPRLGMRRDDQYLLGIRPRRLPRF